MTELPACLLVVAKAPVPGLAKTRLAASIGDQAAADVAAAALLDTLDAVAETPVTHRVVAFTGNLAEAARAEEIRQRLTSFTVVEQRGDDFADRLVHAHTDAAAAAGTPVLQIGMDTPQVTAALLESCTRVLLDGDTVLGLAGDGGWWVLGVTSASTAQCLRRVPMSQSDTGALTLAALRATGADVQLLPQLDDVDTIDDLGAVRAACPPLSRFAALAAVAGGCEMFGNLYERALSGERCWIRHDDGSVDTLPVQTWLGGRQASRAESDFDEAVLDMCDGPTIDLGCGPGRLVTNLVQRGIPALGVDLSPTAISLARDSGAPALRRDLFDPLPGTGRWHNVLLADGNVGLGGDPWRVLRRSAELLRQGGRCLAEFDPDSSGVKVDWIRLESRKTVGPWFRWAWVGVDCVEELASDVGLTLADVHPIGDRVVASLAA